MSFKKSPQVEKLGCGESNYLKTDVKVSPNIPYSIATRLTKPAFASSKISKHSLQKELNAGFQHDRNIVDTYSFD